MAGVALALLGSVDVMAEESRESIAAGVSVSTPNSVPATSGVVVTGLSGTQQAGSIAYAAGPTDINISELAGGTAPGAIRTSEDLIPKIGGLVAVSSGALEVQNHGPLRTVNEGEAGIFALSTPDFSGDTPALGYSSSGVSVLNSGDIVTEAANADGIDVLVLTGRNASVWNSGDLSMQASGSSGIVLATGYPTYGDDTRVIGDDGYSRSSLPWVSGPGAADLEVHNDGLIQIDGDRGAVGIGVMNSVGGAARVTGSGALLISNPDNVGGHGILAVSSAADASVDYSGSIDIHGIQSSGVNVQAGGNASIRYHGDKVEVFGSDSQGLSAVAVGTGNASIDASGAIINHGGDGADSHASGLTAITVGSGSVDVRYSGPQIEVGGDSSVGIAAMSIAEPTSDAGFVRVINSGDVRIHGASGAGIFAGSENAEVRVQNSGNITTDRANAQGIAVETSGGAVSIRNEGDIATAIVGNAVDASWLFDPMSAAHGIAVQSQSGLVDIQNLGHIDVRGEDASGVFASSRGGNGADIRISNDGLIEVSGAPATSPFSVAHGIYASSEGESAIAIRGNGDIRVTNPENVQGSGIAAYATEGQVQIDYSGRITTAGRLADGINAMSVSHSAVVPVDAAAPPVSSTEPDVSVSYTGERIEVLGDHAAAINAWAWGGLGADVSVTAQGELLARANGGEGTDARGIAAFSMLGNATIVFSGSRIEVDGQQASGIKAQADVRQAGVAANVDISNSGDILVHGGNSTGITAAVSAGKAGIANSGNIQTQKAESFGVFAEASAGGTISIQNTGNIRVQGSDSAGVLSRSISAHREAEPEAASPLEATPLSKVSIVNAGTVSALGMNSVAIAALSEGKGVDVHNTGTLSGGAGSGAAILASGFVQGVTNSGNISALSDMAVLFDSSDRPEGLASLRNDGVMIGMVQSTGVMTQVNNTGRWTLRNWADTDGDQIRDTLGVAIGSFGESGASRIDNSGALALSDEAVQVSALNTEHLYRTGYSANNMALDGPLQAQLLGVQTFSNSGTIDLSGARQQPGDVLVISGGQVAGSSGGGEFVSNGGQIKLDTVLNEGGAHSSSDMLVVDGTRLGTAPTTLVVNNVGGAGAQTVGNGIELVRVLDANRSADGAFQLQGRLGAGAYEYELYHRGASTSDGNWYLRSLGSVDPLPPAPPTPAPPPGSKSPRPETGAYTANLAAAGSMFVHTLHDRLGEPQFTEAYKQSRDAVQTAGWIRVVGSHEKGQAAGGNIDTKTDTQLLHFGGDVAQWTGSDGNQRFHMGLMGAIGRSDINASNSDVKYTQNGTRRSAKGTVDGYGLGLYGTWYGNGSAGDGPYVDTWLQHGWYDNTVTGKGMASEHYDSTGWTSSLEGGWAFAVGDTGSRQLMLEPQAQVIYSDVRQDNHSEQNGTQVDNAKASGVTTRLGTRLFSRSQNANAVQPFIEANWWNTSVRNSLSFDSTRIGTHTPDSTYELKAGLQGEIANGLQAWGHVGRQWGQDSFRAYEGAVGIKYDF